MDNALHLPDTENCAALVLLLAIEFEATDGVSTVGDILDGIQANDTPEKAARRPEGRYRALVNIARGNDRLRAMVIDKQSKTMGYADEGLVAAAFYGPVGRVIAFKGTGDGEWNDNGVALIGLPQTNTYYRYDREGRRIGARIVEEMASTQQAQSLDYFYRVTTELGWREPDSVIVAGHSKGGNKAQFITLNTSGIKTCYSYCGQGFSPEALAHYKELLGGEKYDRRAAKVYSISSNNDFVNVLGDRLAPEKQIYFLDPGEVRSTREYHELYMLFGADGKLKKQAPKGKLSLVAERMWADGKTSPDRPAVCMAVMTACEHYYGSGVPLHGEYISDATFFKGGRAAAGMLVRSVAVTLMRAGVDSLSEQQRRRISAYYDDAAGPRAGGPGAALGELVSRALERVADGVAKKDPARSGGIKPLQIGSDEPAFGVDPAKLREEAEHLEQALFSAEHPGEAAATPQNGAHGKGGAPRQTQAERERLARSARNLARTAQEFEETDRELAWLAEMVL